MGKNRQGNKDKSKSKDKKSKDKSKNKSKDKKSKDKKSKDKKSKDKKSKDKKSKDKKSKDKKSKSKTLGRPYPDETRAYLELYKVDLDVTRPQARVLTWAARTHARLASTPEGLPLTLHAFLDELIEQDDRLILFYLEGLLKLYKRSLPELSVHFDIVKDLEDRLGAVSALRGFALMSREIGAPDEISGYIDEQAGQATEGLLEQLDTHWVPRADGTIPALAALNRTVLAADFQSDKKDRALLKKELVRRLQKFNDLELNLDELQGDFGIHELRRQLRWFPIYCKATDGLVQLTSQRNPVPAFKPFLQSELAESKYSKLPPPSHESDVIEISRSLFIANNGYISALGKIKDRGEEIEAIELALVGIGRHHDVHDARDDALAILGKTRADFDAVYLDAKKVASELEEHEFRAALLADLKS